MDYTILLVLYLMDYTTAPLLVYHNPTSTESRKKKKKKEFFLYGDTPTSKVDYYTSTITPLCSKWT